MSGLNFSLSKRKEKIKQAANKGNLRENLNFEGDNKNDTSRIGNVTFHEEMLTTPRSQIENTVYLKVLESATIREGTLIHCNASEKKVFYFGKKNVFFHYKVRTCIVMIMTFLTKSVFSLDILS